MWWDRRWFVPLLATLGQMPLRTPPTPSLQQVRIADTQVMTAPFITLPFMHVSTPTHQACVYLSPTSFHLLMSPVRLADEFAALVPSCFLYLTNLCSRQQTICITAGLPLAWVAAGVVGLRVQVFGLRAQFIGLSDGSEGSRNPILSRYGVRTNTFGQVIIPR